MTYAEIFKACGIGLLCAVLGAVVGKAIGGAAVAVRLAGIALIFGITLGMLDGVVEFLDGLPYTDASGDYVKLMLRGLGISVLCRICSDVCRTCDEPTVAAAVESVGKIGMVLLAMPAARDVIGQVYKLIDAL